MRVAVFGPAVWVFLAVVVNPAIKLLGEQIVDYVGSVRDIPDQRVQFFRIKPGYWSLRCDENNFLVCTERTATEILVELEAAQKECLAVQIREMNDWTGDPEDDIA